MGKKKNKTPYKNQDIDFLSSSVWQIWDRAQSYMLPVKCKQKQQWDISATNQISQKTVAREYVAEGTEHVEISFISDTTSLEHYATK